MDRRTDGPDASGYTRRSEVGEPIDESSVSRRALDRLRAGGPGSFRGTLGRLGEVAGTPMFRAGTAVLMVILVALIVAVLFVRTTTRRTTDATSPNVEPSPIVTTSTSAPGLVVDVGGAVRAPGVYRLGLGARVVDALEAAGGPADDIDLEQVNLAAPVVDGQRVWMTRRGESAKGMSGSASAGATTAPRLDLNAATLEQLDGLPGVGPSTARAILVRRREIGRFRSVDDLLTVKGIGEAKLDALRDSVVVR